MPRITGRVSIAGGEGGAINLDYYREMILASDKTLFKGHPVGSGGCRQPARC